MKVIIIGAGVAGLSAAWRLAQGGAAVVVLDRTQPCRGATYASAGMLAVTGEAGAMPPAESAFARASRAMWPAFAEEIEAASGISAGYRRDGALFVAINDAEARALRLRADEPGSKFLTADEARNRAPMLAAEIHGALWAEDEGQADTRALGRGLVRAAALAGAEVLANEAAVRIDHIPGGGIAIQTPFRRHFADAVLLAAGAWSGELLGLEGLGLTAVRPVKGEMIALAAPPEVALPTPLLWGHGVYLVPRTNRILVGATVEEAGFDTSTTASARAHLFAAACALVPGLGGWPVAEQWAGLRPAAADGLPVIGESSIPGLFVATGQYRNGILFAPAIAQAVVQFILGHTAPPEFAAFSPLRFAAQSGRVKAPASG